MRVRTVGTAQITPPLPGNQKPGLVPGFLCLFPVGPMRCIDQLNPQPKADAEFSSAIVCFMDGDDSHYERSRLVMHGLQHLRQ
jgi:hypothetical protein